MSKVHHIVKETPSQGIVERKPIYGMLTPFEEMERLFDRFFEDFSMPSLFSEERTFAPAFDVSETEKELIVEAEVPGMDKNDISINLSNGLLTIKGEKKHEKKEEKENKRNRRRKKKKPSSFPLLFLES